jgi:hypothetical protein
MVKAYLVKAAEVLTETDYLKYMSIRVRLLGYPQRPPELRIPIADGQFNLKRAPDGLVEHESEAVALLRELAEEMPAFTWAIVPYVNESATVVDYFKS